MVLFPFNEVLPEPYKWGYMYIDLWYVRRYKQISCFVKWKNSRTWVDGRLYKGHWVNAQPHGIGVLTYPDGHEVQGSWDHGHCTNCDVQHAAMHKKEYRPNPIN